MNKFKTKHYEIIFVDCKLSSDIVKKCELAYNKNKKFFGKDYSKYFKIYITDTEKAFKKKTGRFYEPWVKGIGWKGKYIIIRSPRLYAKAYQKYKGTSNFEMLLVHEMNHIFAHDYNLLSGPYWINEGLAMYVANQVPGKNFEIKERASTKEIAKLMFYRLIFRKTCPKMYIPHYYGIKLLIDRYQKKRLILLITKYRKKMKKKEFEQLFERVYGIEYTVFLKNAILKMPVK